MNTSFTGKPRLVRNVVGFGKNAAGEFFWNGLHVDGSVAQEQIHRMEKKGLFVAISKFAVANGMTAEVKQAFVARPHMVDSAEGFVRLDVLSPIEKTDEIWLLTYWQDEGSFRAWHKSHLYRDSHKGIPKGLKLDPAATEIRYFQHIAS